MRSAGDGRSVSMFSLVIKGLSSTRSPRFDSSNWFQCSPSSSRDYHGRQACPHVFGWGFNVLPRHQGIVICLTCFSVKNLAVSMFSLVIKGLSLVCQAIKRFNWLFQCSPSSPRDCHLCMQAHQWHPDSFNVLPRHQGIVIDEVPVLKREYD